MPVTQIPSRDPQSREALPGTPGSAVPPPSPPSAGSPEQRDLFEAMHWESAYRGFDPDDVPHLLIQLQDDLSRARKREALWLSVILHLFVVILLWNLPKLMDLLPHQKVDLAITANDKSKDATFLELPPDAQKLTKRPDAKVISDKDRIATSKAPQIDRKELKKLLESQHPGQPGANVPMPPAQSAPPQVAQNQPTPQPPAPQPQQNSGFTAPTNDQTPRLQTPPQTRPTVNFNTPLTPGSAIQQAERAAAENRGRSGGGVAGDYGLSQGRGGYKAMAPAEILTDTMGVDFGPYMTRIVQIVKQNWYTLMPPSVYPPTFKQGKLALEFVIMKDGSVQGLVRDTTSGDVALDRAAMASITASTPFPPLPKEFPGKLLGLRFYYFYNLEPSPDLK
ncbi:MAG TPA: TonB C-terminal domain-containing protein [Terriglobales bacterium]|jgi:outer membrane biosynthesis protein TonB|nr:TonB C-terminal domain-containing protein [Terriglobales bacterium]